MRINFYLKNKDTDKEIPILLSFYFNRKRLQYHTGISCKYNQWNVKKQYIYGNTQQVAAKNNLLRQIKSFLETEYSNDIANGKFFDRIHYKTLLDEKFKGKNNSSDEQLSFWQIFNLAIENKSKYIKTGTVKKYISLKNHLQKLEKKLNIKLSFEKINKDFYETFIDYFIEAGNLNSTIKEKQLKTFNSFLNWAVEKEYIEQNPFKNIKFPYKNSPTDSFALTEKQLKHLLNFDLCNNERLDKVRDVFCFECYTGLRYSDTQEIKEINKDNRFLRVIVKKKSEPLTVPLLPEAENLLFKYFNKNQQFPKISNQKMNSYLKELGKIVGFNDEMEFLKISGNKETKIIKKQYELLTTHVGRRTFVTLSVQKGMDIFLIRKITGHANLDTFMRYYKINELIAAEKFVQMWDRYHSNYANIDIIKNLLIKNVDVETIAFAFGIEKNEIEKLNGV
ncbi:MAG: site-specific integrase [Bacteroidales bacterium]|nr:site-specific integrase [Bacteroidales bacterium]